MNQENHAAAATRPLGLAQLSLLTAEPPRLVQLAADAGFDFVGVRVRPVTSQEKPFDLQPGSDMLAETLSRMADTGVTVRDIEFLLLDGSAQRDAWLQMLEAGQALGASSMTVAVADTDLHRVVDNVGQMVEDARAYNIIPAVEPISYQAINSLSLAKDVSRQTGAQILADTLHVARFGGTTEELKDIAADVPMVQVCDSFVQMPEDRDALVEESRSERYPAGEGEQDIAGMIRAADPAGQLPVSAEVPNNQLHQQLGDVEWVQRLYTTTREVADHASE